ncbi:unnamed protein product [Toxocara canis]|uniref:CACTA en-spm transposon protein n=1 Tax=Toxocara canis TaxID=6265 RepID=A0A183UET1_TOXCA|nr:unnamed protein product [Toxocara canis]
MLPFGIPSRREFTHKTFIGKIEACDGTWLVPWYLPQSSSCTISVDAGYLRLLHNIERIAASARNLKQTITQFAEGRSRLDRLSANGEGAETMETCERAM